MNYITWAKEHKKSLVKQIVGDVKPPIKGEPLAVFAAGIPGAGKTEFLDRLFEGSLDAVRIDLDEIVKLFPDYKPENYYKYRGAAHIIVDEVVIYCRHHKLHFVLDGTFGSPRAIDNIKSALKRHSVVIFYVWKEPELAWQHTKDRQLLIKRGVEKEGFIESCLKIPKNIGDVRDKFNDKAPIVVIKKDPNSDRFTYTQNSEHIDDLIEVKYNESELRKALV